MCYTGLKSEMSNSIISIASLHHLSTEKKAFRSIGEMYRLLKLEAEY